MTDTERRYLEAQQLGYRTGSTYDPEAAGILLIARLLLAKK